MQIKEFLFQNKSKIKLPSLALTLLGIIITTLYYGTEPWETLGGFLCGIGLGLLMTSIGIKAPKTNEN